VSKTYFAEIVELQAEDKASGCSGSLQVHTRINLRGSPNKGAVPVEVEHYAIFTFDDPLLVEPDQVPLGGGYFQREDNRVEVTQITRGFQSAGECHSWATSHFVLTPEEERRLTSRCT